jgi:hypothetical protein
MTRKYQNGEANNMTTVFYDHNVALPKNVNSCKVIEWAQKHNIEHNIGALYASFKNEDDAILFTMTFGRGSTHFETVNIRLSYEE